MGPEFHEVRVPLTSRRLHNTFCCDMPFSPFKDRRKLGIRDRVKSSNVEKIAKETFSSAELVRAHGLA